MHAISSDGYKGRAKYAYQADSNHISFEGHNLLSQAKVLNSKAWLTMQIKEE